VNSELVNLYWQIGQYISLKLEKAVWGDGTVAELAIQIQNPDNKENKIVAPVVQQLQ
jgi:hypothetical protein